MRIQYKNNNNQVFGDSCQPYTCSYINSNRLAVVDAVSQVQVLKWRPARNFQMIIASWPSRYGNSMVSIHAPGIPLHVFLTLQQIINLLLESFNQPPFHARKSIHLRIICFRDVRHFCLYWSHSQPHGPISLKINSTRPNCVVRPGPRHTLVSCQSWEYGAVRIKGLPAWL